MLLSFAHKSLIDTKIRDYLNICSTYLDITPFLKCFVTLSHTVLSISLSIAYMQDCRLIDWESYCISVFMKWVTTTPADPAMG